MKSLNKSIYISLVLLLFNNSYTQELKTESAKIQLIHNSGDIMLRRVDVYINDRLILKDFAFRTASQFLSITTSTPVSINIAPANSTSTDQSIYSVTTSLLPLYNYIIVIDGVSSRTEYTPRRPLKLNVYSKGRIISDDPNNIDLLFHHGSTDAPIVNIEETALPLGKIVGNTSYGQFAANYLELPSIDYRIKINAIPAIESVVRESPADFGTFYLPLSTLGLRTNSVTLLTSGFVDPEKNSNGERFGLFLALPSGGNLLPLQLVSLGNQNFSAQNIKMYPNPASSTVNIAIPMTYIAGNIQIIDLSGREVLKNEKIDSQINISNLSNGVYIINLNIDNNNYRQKLIVDR